MTEVSVWFETSSRQSESIIRLNFTWPEGKLARSSLRFFRGWPVLQYSFRFLWTFCRSMPIVFMAQEGVTSHTLWFGSPYETRPQVHCSYLLIPSAHHIARNLSLLPNTSPLSIYINSSSTILTSSNIYSSACPRIYPHQWHRIVCTYAYALTILIRRQLMVPAAPHPHVVWSTSQVPDTGIQCVTLDEQECHKSQQALLEQSSTSLRSWKRPSFIDEISFHQPVRPWPYYWDQVREPQYRGEISNHNLPKAPCTTFISQLT